MFGKKILSIVGLVFLGSQLASVNAEECTAIYDRDVSNCNELIGECTANKLYLVGTAENGQTIQDKSVVRIINGGCELVNGSEEYCWNGSTNELLGRKSEYCSEGTRCDKYYSCDDGVCKESTIDYHERDDGSGGQPDQTCDTNEKLIAGGTACAGRADDYYFIASATGKTNVDLFGALNVVQGDTGYLYKCTIAAVTGVSTCNEEPALAGYFKSQNEGYEYIRCDPTDNNGTTCKGLIDTPVNAEQENYHIPNGDQCNEMDGKLIKIGNSYRLCFNGGVPFVKASFFVLADITNAFNDKVLPQSGNNVYYFVVDIDNKSAVVQRDENPKKYKYALSSTLEIIEKSDAANKGICAAQADFNNEVAHEFQMTIPVKDSNDVDNVNYYRDLDYTPN